MKTTIVWFGVALVVVSVADLAVGVCELQFLRKRKFWMKGTPASNVGGVVAVEIMNQNWNAIDVSVLDGSPRPPSSRLKEGKGTCSFACRVVHFGSRPQSSRNLQYCHQT